MVLMILICPLSLMRMLVGCMFPIFFFNSSNLFPARTMLYRRYHTSVYKKSFRNL